MNEAPVLAPTTIAVRSSQTIQDAVDGQIVVLHAETGTCYVLNGVGSRIWALMQEPRQIREICATLVDEYEVNGAVCSSQVSKLLTALRAASLVELRENPMADI